MSTGNALLSRAIALAVPAPSRVGRLSSRTLPLLSMLALPPLLGSCGPERNMFPPACPVPSKVKPLAELTRYRPGSQDLRDLIVRAEIFDIPGRCRPGENKDAVHVTVQVVADVSRGPALQGDTVDLPVFIALTDANGIRDKKLFTLPVAFAHNVDNARAVSPEFEMELAVTPKTSGASYGIVAGFQLTPEELAVYRRNNHR